MPVLLIVVVLLVLGTLAVVASTRSDPVEGGLAGADQEPAGALGLPAPGEQLVAADLEALRFSVVARGYRASEVEAVLDRLAQELAERDTALAALRVGSPGAGDAPAAADRDTARTVDPDEPPAGPPTSAEGDHTPVTTPGDPPAATLQHRPLDPPSGPGA